MLAPSQASIISPALLRRRRSSPSYTTVGSTSSDMPLIMRDPVRGTTTEISLDGRLRTSSDDDIVLPWYADLEMVRRFLRTLQYLQTTARAVSRMATETPFEAADNLGRIVTSTLEGALTPISPSMRATMIQSSYNPYRRGLNGSSHASSSSSSHNMAGGPMGMGMLGMDGESRLPMFKAMPEVRDSSFASPLRSLMERVFAVSPSEGVIDGNMVINLLLFVADRTGVSLDGSNQALPATVILRVLETIARATGVSLSKEAMMRRKYPYYIEEEPHDEIGGGISRGSLIMGNVGLADHERYPDTGLVMSYREHDTIPLTWRAARRMREMMHHEINLKPFDAEILIPTSEARANFNRVLNDVGRWEELMGGPVSLSPQSFPPSPHAKFTMMHNFRTFTDEVLYRARDELRSVEAGTTSVRLAVFNPDDAHADIKLTKGCNCASKVGEGLYRSVRAAAPIPNTGVPVLFEMSIQPAPTMASLSDEERAPAVSEGCGSSICVGVATSALNLNSHVGATATSIGVCSSGYVVADGQWTLMNRSSFRVGDTVGCLVIVEADSMMMTDEDASPSTPESHDGVAENDDCSEFYDCGEFVSEEYTPRYAAGRSHGDSPHTARSFSAPPPAPLIVKVWFFLNGRLLSCSGHEAISDAAPFVIRCPSTAEVYPTLSLYSSDVQVMCHFAAADVTHANRVSSRFPNAIGLDGLPLVA